VYKAALDPASRQLAMCGATVPGSKEQEAHKR
jgi:hypothetical protein